MNPEEIQQINGLRSRFPSQISVRVTRSEDGRFVAHIDTFKGLFTEGNDFSELIEMVNDAVKTYFEIPEGFLAYMPNYVPPLEVAQRLDVFPITKVKETIVLPSSVSEQIAC